MIGLNWLVLTGIRYFNGNTLPSNACFSFGALFWSWKNEPFPQTNGGKRREPHHVRGFARQINSESYNKCLAAVSVAFSHRHSGIDYNISSVIDYAPTHTCEQALLVVHR